MKELLQYRVELIERLDQAAHTFRSQCILVDNVFAPVDNGWNVHQIAVHTRDVDKQVYGARARRTAVEDNPEFENFDGEAFMAEHYSPDEPLNKILDELVQNVDDLVEMLTGLPREAWSRESRHTMLGSGFTLQLWVERDLAHLEEHLKSIQRYQQG